MSYRERKFPPVQHQWEWSASSLGGGICRERYRIQLAIMTDKLHLYQDKPAQPTSGNLFDPLAEGTGISGGWKTASGRRQGEGGSVIPRIAIGVATVLPVMLLVRWLLQNRRAQIGFLAKVAARVMG